MDFLAVCPLWTDIMNLQQVFNDMNLILRWNTLYFCPVVFIIAQHIVYFHDSKLLIHSSRKYFEHFLVSACVLYIVDTLVKVHYPVFEEKIIHAFFSARNSLLLLLHLAFSDSSFKISSDDLWLILALSTDVLRSRFGMILDLWASTKIFTTWENCVC